MKKLMFFILALMSMSAYAISLPVTEGMVNSQVSKSFPKTVKKIELSNPQIVLLDGGKSVLCMDGLPRIMFLDKSFKFCATFKPQWNEKQTQLEATHLELTDMDIQGVGTVSKSLKVILNEVLIGIEPVVLYKSDSWLMKQVSSIEVEKGMMYLKF